MKKFRFIAAVATLLLGSAVIVADAAAEAQIVNIGRKYSKAQLDAICAREGGKSYGAAETAYGCAKGDNVVACGANKTCLGYVWLVPDSPGAASDFRPIGNWRGTAELVLDMPSRLPKAGLDGVLTTAQ